MSNLYTIIQRTGAVAATHSGSFHADDVLAAATLRLINPSLPILRTRHQAELDAADILFDVGRIFEPETCRFDHHQPEYGEMRENGIPYSSFGQVWREVGVELCGSVLAASRVDRWLVQGVDALDCGVSLSKGNHLVNVMSISSIIAGFNPGWQEDVSNEARYEAFVRAMDLATVVLKNIIRDAVGAEHASVVVTQGSLLDDGKLLVLDRDVPWKETVMGSRRYDGLLYVIAPDTQTKWHVNTVPDVTGNFSNRKALPQGWAGLDGEALDEVVGMKDCIFCHRGRFVAGHKTKEGALEMARLALRA